MDKRLIHLLANDGFLLLSPVLAAESETRDARAGRQMATKAVETLEEFAREARERLDLYRAGQPYRQAVK